MWTVSQLAIAASKFRFVHMILRFHARCTSVTDGDCERRDGASSSEAAAEALTTHGVQASNSCKSFNGNITYLDYM